MRDIRIKLFHEPFPVDGAGGMVAQDNKGEYMIVINSNLSEDEQAFNFLHEVLHIYNDDFTRAQTEGVNQIEQQTDEQIKRFCRIADNSG